MSRAAPGRHVDPGAGARDTAVGPYRDAPAPADLLAAFFGLGIAFLLAAVAVGVTNAATPWSEGRWLALHLAFVGGVSQLVLGASQFFAGAFLATAPPGRALVRAQLVTWNLGAVLVAVGVTSDHDLVAAAGSGLLLAGLALLGAGFRAMRSASLQRRPWATRWYSVAAGFLAVGVVAGVALSVGASWSLGSLAAAHLVLNVAGWFGTAIVGTLHTLFPSLTGTRLRFPRLQAPAFVAWALGVTALSAGYAFDVEPAAALGWAGLMTAASLLATNLVASALRAPHRLPTPACLLAVAQCFLLAGLATALTAALVEGPTGPVSGPERSALAVLLLAGWLGLTVLGSMLHLLFVVLGVRDPSRAHSASGAGRDGVVVAIACIGVLGLAAGRLLPLEALVPPAALALAAAYAILLARVVTLAGRALRHGGLRV